MKIISYLHDVRSNCHSLMTEIKLCDYLELIGDIYEQQGNIDGQRAAITTKSGKKIRDRMVDDIIQGAVLPPIVLGIVMDNNVSEAKCKEYLLNEKKEYQSSISLIDGMQRTTAFKAAMRKMEKTQENSLLNKIIRVEFWISNNTSSLLYRMLILNTGQVPWNIRRQIEIIYNPLIGDIKKNVTGISLANQDDKTKRKNAGEFPADKIIELYLSFAARSETVDTKDTVTSEFTRLDVIESSTTTDFNKLFHKTLELLVRFDKIIFDYKSDSELKFSKGSDLFKSQPARIGFVASISKYVFGLPGLIKDESRYTEKMEFVVERYNSLFDMIEEKYSSDLETFLDFDTLNENLNVITSKIGDFERKFFTSAFGIILNRDIDVEDITLEVCWRNAQS